MPSTSELSPIAAQHGASTASSSGEPAKVGLQPFELLKRHAKLAAAVSAGVFLAGILAIRIYQKPSFDAKAIVYVSPTFPTALGDDHEHDRQYDEFLEQQVTAPIRYETLQKALHKFPDAWASVYPGESEQNKIQRLQKVLKVEQVGHSYEVSISLETDKPQHLAEFVNQITAEYLDDARGEEGYGGEQKLTTLKQEKSELQKELDADMQKQNQLLQYVGMAHYDESVGANPYDEQLAKLREQLGQAHEKTAEADAELRSLGNGNSPSPALQQSTIEEINADPSMTAIRAQLTAKKSASIIVMTGMKPDNPLYIQAQADIAEIDQHLDQINRDASKKAAGHIQQRALAAKTRAANLENQLSSDISRTTAQASTAAPRLQQAQVLDADIARILASQAAIDTRLQNLSLEGNSLGSVHLFSSALPPTAPVKRKTAIAYGAVFVFSLIAGFAAAYLADSIDPHIYTSLDIRRLVGFPPIGLLLNRTEFSPDMQREYVLRLAGGLDQAHRRTGARTFVFPSVGRSSSLDLVQQLGTELSANGLRVLVVEVQSPSTSRTPPRAVETATPAGRLLSMTDGSTHLSTEVDKEPYRVISMPAPEVADLLRRSRSYYNAILVAADPLFTSAYTEHFARTADGTVLIVNSGVTRKDELVRAARLLERLKIAGIAIVLDGVTEKRAEDDVARTIADYRRNAA